MPRAVLVRSLISTQGRRLCATPFVNRDFQLPQGVKFRPTRIARILERVRQRLALGELGFSKKRDDFRPCVILE